MSKSIFSKRPSSTSRKSKSAKQPASAPASAAPDLASTPAAPALPAASAAQLQPAQPPHATPPLTLGDFIIARIPAVGGVRLRFKCETCGSQLVRFVGSSPFAGCPNGHGGLTAFVRPSKVKELALQAAPKANRIGGYSGRYSIDGHAGAEFKRAATVSVSSTERKYRKPVRFVIRHDSVIPDGMVLASTGWKLRLFERVPEEVKAAKKARKRKATDRVEK